MEDITPKAKELLDMVPKEVFDKLFDDKEPSKGCTNKNLV